MIIASRMLTLRTQNGDLKIPINVFAPEKTVHGSWSCRYEIDWPDKKHALDVGGFDSAQALILALQTIGAEIYTSSYPRIRRRRSPLSSPRASYRSSSARPSWRRKP
jgi:hypothetical protein